MWDAEPGRAGAAPGSTLTSWATVAVSLWWPTPTPVQLGTALPGIHGLVQLSATLTVLAP